MWTSSLSSLRRAGIALASTFALASIHAQEVTVVSVQAMTVPVAFAGAPYQNAIRMAFEEAAAKGTLGGVKVKLIEADNGSDKGQAINLANQAIDRDKAVLVLGFTSSVDSMAVSPIFNDKKTPLISLGTADAIVAAGPWSYKVQQGAADISPLIAQYALDKMKVRKVVTITDRSNAGFVDFRKYFAEAFVAGGGTVVAEETVVTADTNFLPLATKLKGMEFDAIYLATLGEQGGNVMVQLRQAGLADKVRVIGSLGVASVRYLEVGGKAVEGTISTSEFVPGMDRAQNKAFEAAYLARYKVAPDSWAATGYASAQIALAALKAAGPNPDREKVRNALSKLKDVPVVVGGGLWNHVERKPKYGAVIIAGRDGKYVAAPQ